MTIKIVVVDEIHISISRTKKYIDPDSNGPLKTELFCHDGAKVHTPNTVLPQTVTAKIVVLAEIHIVSREEIKIY